MPNFEPRTGRTSWRFSPLPDGSVAQAVTQCAAKDSFFQGREFYCFGEFSLNGTSVYRIVHSVPIILFGVDVTLSAGALAVKSYSSPTFTAGTNTTLAVFPTNQMTTNASNTQVLLGGSITGGIQTSTALLKTDANVNRATLVNASTGEVYGLAAGTNYFQFVGTSATGVFMTRWAEIAV